MNGAVAAAQRSAEVRTAALAWQREGLLDDTGLAEVGRRHPDDRRRAGLAFRLLLLGSTLVAGGAAFGLAATVLESPLVAWLALVAFASLTEVAVVGWRFAGRGPEEATATLTFVAGLVAVGWSLDDWIHVWSRNGETLLLLSGVALACAIVWRWGMPVFGAVGAACLFWCLGRQGPGRVLMGLVALALVTVAVAGARSRRLAPAHRSASVWVLLTSLGVLYLVVNLATYDRQWIERVMAHEWSSAAVPALRPWFAMATALLPLVVLAGGVWLRDRAMLLGGTLMVVLSLFTLRHYIHLAPLWLLLTAGGTVVIGVTLGLRRLLETGPNRERHGFTAQPLDVERPRTAVVETAVAVAAMQPTPREPELPAAPRFEGGGGQLGGGGASGDF